MRTTLTLDDEVYAKARKRAFDEHRSLGDVISELAKRSLESEPTKLYPAINIGFMKGQIWIADDFDETPQDILDAIDAPLF